MYRYLKKKVFYLLSIVRKNLQTLQVNRRPYFAIDSTFQKRCMQKISSVNQVTHRHLEALNVSNILLVRVFFWRKVAPKFFLIILFAQGTLVSQIFQNHPATWANRPSLVPEVK